MGIPLPVPRVWAVVEVWGGATSRPGPAGLSGVAESPRVAGPLGAVESLCVPDLLDTDESPRLPEPLGAVGFFGVTEARGVTIPAFLGAPDVVAWVVGAAPVAGSAPVRRETTSGSVDAAVEPPPVASGVRRDTISASEAPGSAPSTGAVPAVPLSGTDAVRRGAADDVGVPGAASAAGSASVRRDAGRASEAPEPAPGTGAMRAGPPSDPPSGTDAVRPGVADDVGVPGAAPVLRDTTSGSVDAVVEPLPGASGVRRDTVKASEVPESAPSTGAVAAGPPSAARSEAEAPAVAEVLPVRRDTTNGSVPAVVAPLPAASVVRRDTVGAAGAPESASRTGVVAVGPPSRTDAVRRGAADDAGVPGAAPVPVLRDTTNGSVAAVVAAESAPRSGADRVGAPGAAFVPVLRGVTVRR
ncbi:hypothetical protein [Streptomyces sp. NPDC013457]|uniref:hypothetical protein n=1 Tax=Streptomyces sp. NPDC013457 TaxID=3364866 RepID=UPI0036F899B5